MGISRSTYYDKPAISIDDTALVETMAAISESFEAYGYRRMQAALRHRGLIVNHKTIRRLMREHGLSGILCFGAIVTPMEGAYGHQEGHPGSVACGS